MGCKYDRCSNDACDNGRMCVAGRSMKCPVCKGEGYLDTRLDEAFRRDPALRMVLGDLLGGDAQEKLS